jgi:hypothetical protein
MTRKQFEKELKKHTKAELLADLYRALRLLEECRHENAQLKKESKS